MQTSRGFTLLEVLVSVSILGVFSAAIWPAFNNQQRVNFSMERRTAAIQAAQQVLDNLRVLDPQDMPTSGSSTNQTVNIGNYEFNVVSYFCSDSTYCISTNTRHIAVEVLQAENKIYEVETVYTKLR